MGKWTGGGGCFGNLIEFQTCDAGHKIGAAGGHAMPGLAWNLSTRYHKLDDSVFLLCQHCGHSVKTDELKKMATYRGTTPKTRFRANSKHFLTWSATAANHKLQKLSKNFVTNVSKLQSKFPFQNSAHHHQPSLENEDSSDWEPPCMNNGLGRSFNNSNNGGINNGSHSSSANLMANDSLVLNNNNNNNNNSVTLSNTTAVIRDANVNTNNTKYNNASASVSHNLNKIVGNRENYDKEVQISSSSVRPNLSEKSTLVVKNLLGVQVTNTFELRPVVASCLSLTEGQQSESTSRLALTHTLPTSSNGKHFLNNSNNSSNNASSLCTISLAATTLPLISPHWSRSSSMSNSTIGLSNSQGTTQQCDSPTNNDSRLIGHHLDHHHHPPHHHHLLLSEEGSRRKNNNKALLPLFSSRSSTGSNNSGSGSGSGRSLSPVDDDHRLPTIPIATSSPINNKLTVTIFEEEAELRHAPWFQAGIPREIALEVLRNEPIGAFIVRESTTKSGCFALSMRVPREFQPKGIAHYLILRTGRGYKIKGFMKEFQSLVSLITHHSVMPELLPCPLSLHRYGPKYSRRRINSSDFVEPEKLIPLRKFTDF